MQHHGPHIPNSESLRTASAYTALADLLYLASYRQQFVPPLLSSACSFCLIVSSYHSGRLSDHGCGFVCRVDIHFVRTVHLCIRLLSLCMYMCIIEQII